MLRAISIRQPYASLLMHGVKMFESRAWSTLYRGTVLVHASTQIKHRETDIFYHPEVLPTLRALGYQSPTQMPTGVILGTIELVSCCPFQSYDSEEFKPIESILTPFDKGHWVWKFANPVFFEKKPMYRGRLGVFNVEEEVIHGCA